MNLLRFNSFCILAIKVENKLVWTGLVGGLGAVASSLAGLKSITQTANLK